MNRRRSKQPKSLAALLLTAILGLIAAYFQGFTKPSSDEKPKRPSPVESTKPTPPSVDPKRDRPTESIPTDDASAEVIKGFASHVKDGDSFVLQTGNEEKDVRLWGIDAPEGNTRQPYAGEARDFARQLYQRKNVTIVVHDRDQYGRIVGEVFLADRTSVNEQIIDAGWAWHFRRHAAEKTSFADAQARAQQAERGLWKDSDPIPPWEWRRDHPPRPKN